MKLGVRRRERVVRPKATLPGLDQHGAAEVRKVTRDRRLRHVEDLDQIADAQLAIAEQMQDAQPRPIGERRELVGDGIWKRRASA